METELISDLYKQWFIWHKRDKKNIFSTFKTEFILKCVERMFAVIDLKQRCQ